MSEISLKELLNQTLALNQDEWEDLSKDTREKILKLIDPENVALATRKKSKKVAMTEKGREVVREFINMPLEELNEMKPYIRNRLLKKVTELAQAAGKAA